MLRRHDLSLSRTQSLPLPRGKYKTRLFLIFSRYFESCEGFEARINLTIKNLNV